MDLPEEFDVVSVDPEESDNDAICSMSEGETNTKQHCGLVTEVLPSKEFLFVLIGEEGGWQVQVNVPEEQAHCEHTWQENTEIETAYIKCRFCGQQTSQRSRAHCGKCQLTTCPLCADHYLKIRVTTAPPPQKQFDSKKLISELIEYVDYLLAENRRLQMEINMLREGKSTEDERLTQELIEDLQDLTLWGSMNAPARIRYNLLVL